MNAILKQHNRVVYSSQAIHHVARQIESLYWNSVNREVNGPEARGSGIEKGTDLSNPM